MDEAGAPQLYLIVSAVEPTALSALLDAAPVACVRLEMAGAGEAEIGRAAEALRPVCHERDIALLLTTHFRLVQPTGLDGVHLFGSRDVREARGALGAGSIVGAYAGASGHAGMTAGEIGADYIAFGPVSQTSLGTGDLAPDDLFSWWSEAVELPVVAEGGVTLARAQELKDRADFIALGPEVTATEDPAEALRAFHAAIQP